MAKNDNQMKAHFRKSVADIDRDILGLQKDIDRLTAARTTLVDLYGGETDIPVPMPAPAKAPKAQAESGKIVNVCAKRGALAAQLQEALQGGASWSVEKLCELTGAPVGSVRSQLYRWKGKSWLKQNEAGEWMGAFPAE